jgi:hypothetical protein
MARVPKLLRPYPPWSERHSEMQRPQRMNLGPFLMIASGTIADLPSRIQAPDQTASHKPPSREQTFPKEVGGLSFPQAEVA